MTISADERAAAAAFAAKMRTGEQGIAMAIAEGALFKVDHETKRFVGFRYTLRGVPRATVTRVHKDTALCAALLAIAA
jgi:hypothetical protein